MNQFSFVKPNWGSGIDEGLVCTWNGSVNDVWINAFQLSMNWVIDPKKKTTTTKVSLSPDLVFNYKSLRYTSKCFCMHFNVWEVENSIQVSWMKHTKFIPHNCLHWFYSLCTKVQYLLASSSPWPHSFDFFLNIIFINFTFFIHIYMKMIF